MSKTYKPLNKKVKSVAWGNLPSDSEIKNAKEEPKRPKLEAKYDAPPMGDAPPVVEPKLDSDLAAEIDTFRKSPEIPPEIDCEPLPKYDILYDQDYNDTLPDGSVPFDNGSVPFAYGRNAWKYEKPKLDKIVRDYEPKLDLDLPDEEAYLDNHDEIRSLFDFGANPDAYLDQCVQDYKQYLRKDGAKYDDTLPDGSAPFANGSVLLSNGMNGWKPKFDFDPVEYAYDYFDHVPYFRTNEPKKIQEKNSPLGVSFFIKCKNHRLSASVIREFMMNDKRIIQIKMMKNFVLIVVRPDCENTIGQLKMEFTEKITAMIKAMIQKEMYSGEDDSIRRAGESVMGLVDKFSSAKM